MGDFRATRLGSSRASALLVAEARLTAVPWGQSNDTADSEVAYAGSRRISESCNGQIAAATTGRIGATSLSNVVGTSTGRDYFERMYHRCAQARLLRFDRQTKFGPHTVRRTC